MLVRCVCDYECIIRMTLLSNGFSRCEMGAETSRDFSANLLLDSFEINRKCGQTVAVLRHLHYEFVHLENLR